MTGPVEAGAEVRWTGLGELGRARTTGAFLRALGGMLLRILAFTVLFGVLLVPPYLLLVEGRGMGALEGLYVGAALELLAALVAGMVLLRFLDGRRPGALGVALSRRTLPELGGGFLVGAGALAVAVVLSLAGGLTFRGDEGTPGGWVAMALWTLVGFGVAAFAEEAIFRGYPFQVLVRGVGAVAATLILSGLFAWAHAANPEVGPFALANIFLAGVLLSVAYLRTGSLWYATAVHVGWNWTMATLFDLPVSGIALVDAPLYEPVLGGAAWLTGGAFGPEGGLVGTVGFAAALLAVLRWPRAGMGPDVRALRPLIIE